MITQQHTPGPWRTGKVPHGDCRVYSDSHEHAIARTYGPDLNGIGVCQLTGPTNKADALLIAAAPELLEAVYLCACYVQLVHLVNPTPESKAHLGLLESVIKKVTGEQA